MKRTLIFLCILVSGTAEIFPQQSLIGTWKYETIYGTSQIVFNKNNTVIVDGETAKYAVQGDYIIISDEYGTASYQYRFSNGNLILTFPDGSQAEFQKAGQNPGASQSGSNSGSISTKQNNQAKPSGQSAGSQGTGQQNSAKGGNAGQLYGKLCFYSGSSSSYSGYSRMEYLYFDGKGRFQFWKESSFSSDAGLAYGSDQDPNYVGSYRINGDVVTMTFDSGQTNTLKVNMRQNSGRITELMYGQKLYATGLCQ